MISIRLKLNGKEVGGTVEGRTSIADFVRDTENLTATHLACEHGVCGACTVLVEGAPVRGCITLAAALDGQDVQTLEAFEADPVMGIIRESFSEAHGLQCGFCTPGMLLTVRDIILREAAATASDMRRELSGNICRCTGYSGIVDAAELASRRVRDHFAAKADQAA